MDRSMGRFVLVHKKGKKMEICKQRTPMIEQIKDTLFPVGGGLFGSIFSMLTFNNIIDTIVIAAIGAMIGYLVKWAIDWFRFDILKKKKYRNH